MTQDNATLIGRRVGNYVVERSLAQGGMGAVFVARHPALGREAAVKFLGHDFEAPPELTKRFLDEARITANLRHPNVVDIFDFGELDGRLYYVMELLKGYDLSDLLKRRKRFDATEAIELLSQISKGLAAAHTLGVVHRDLKPANVFVLEGEPLRVKLMDFGIAKVLSSATEHTSYGQIMGTPRYMSPEQALGQVDKISPKSDLYSLGVIAYEMLAGVAPFEHESPVMLLVMHVRDNFRPLSALAPDCPVELIELIEACLNKEASERPASAGEIVERLQAIRRPADSGSSPSATSNVVVVDELQMETPIELVALVERSRLGSDDTIPEGAHRLEVPLVSVIEIAVDNSPLAAPTMHAAVAQPAPTMHTAVAQPTPAPAPAPKTPPAPAPKTPPAPAPKTPPAPAPKTPPAPAPDLPAPRTLDLVALTQGSDPQEVAPEGHTDTVHLTETDRNVLNKLLMRMQRKGDFPAFMQNVGEVNKRADVEGSYSAEQLGTSILKDYALTAKLLRIVNSAYANRFGGKIYSVQHAIVILGFDRIRQLALSISLFKSQGKKEHASRVSESAINSLVSSEISRQLYSEARLDDPEQAVVCSMFRNLGRHLVLVYLPELYDQILTLMEQEHLGLNKASERVLGVSMHKLGVGIAERWRLPQRMIAAMAVIPERSGNLYREEDRLSALSEFSNQLCEIVSGDLDSTTKTQALGTLTNKHRHLLTIDNEEMASLLVTVQESFEKRYSSLLGGTTKTSRFSRNVSRLVEQAVEQPPPADPQVEPSPMAAAALAPELATPAEPRPDGPVQEVRGAKPKRAIAKLQLAKTNIGAEESEFATPADSAAAEEFHSQLTDLQARAKDNSTGETELLGLLTAIAALLGLPRVLLLKTNAQLRELSVCAGVGEDAEGLTKELHFPLSPARSALDPFSIAFHNNRSCVIEDCFSPKVSSVMPARYYETLGSASLLLCHIPGRANLAYVLLADWDPPLIAPSQAKINKVCEAKPLLSQLAQAATR